MIMGVKQRRLKVLMLSIGGSSVECQLNSWNYDPGIKDGDRQYTFCPDGEFTEETDPDPTLDCKFFSDWRAGGISDYLYQHNGEVVDFVLDHHPNIPGEHVRWSGQLRVKAAPVGGDARATEMTEITFQVQGEPVYERPSD